MIGGGREATDSGNPKERRSGGALRKAGKRARMVKRWNWDTRRSLVGWR